MPDLTDVAEAYLATLAADDVVEMPITGLDRVGIPVWAVWGRSGADLLGGIGYGPTDAQARVGALGESVEHALCIRAVRSWPRTIGSYAELVATLGTEHVIDPRLLGLPAGDPYDDDRPLQWLPTRRLGSDDTEPVLVPAEMIASAPSELGPPPRAGWLFPAVSNGLGAGPTVAHAAEHALLEVLQRDGNGLGFRALDRGVVLDLDGVQDPDTLAALDRLAAAGIDVLAKLGATDFGLPNVYVVGTAADDDVLRATACGEAVHPDREVALRKAVLEFASARVRKAFMHGPVADVAAIAPPGYLDGVVPSMDPSSEELRVLDAMVEWLRLPAEAWRPRIEATVLRRSQTVPFGSLPTTTHTNGQSVLDDVHGRLTRAGFDVLVAVLADGTTPTTGGMLAVKVVVPGMEVETVAYGRIGERGVRRLLDAGRDDLVRVGTAPDAHWARIHLTSAAEERLGGPAWLDRTALDAVADGLLPLYREPGRHTAQQVLA